jgi:hypothetical protein
MKKIPHWVWILGGGLVCFVLAIVLSLPTTTPRQTVKPSLDASTSASLFSAHEMLTKPNLGVHAADVNAEMEAAGMAQDLCLHCHLSGEVETVGTPTARWLLFGGAGLIFAFGVVRSAGTWRVRKPWKPFSARAVDWVDERYQIKEPLAKAGAKPVPRFARQWFYCLGGITALLFVVQAITGILLAFYYKPTPADAYNSILYIENEVFFGAATRSIHHWAANGMIVVCIAHMFRVFITGAYRAPRELNWIAGVLLLLMTLGFGFTGYLLPWDQRAFWATTVGTDIAGGVPDAGPLLLVFLRAGWTVTGETLSRFFAIHVLVLPALTVSFMGLHFLMIRRQGIARPL